LAGTEWEGAVLRRHLPLLGGEEGGEQKTGRGKSPFPDKRVERLKTVRRLLYCSKFNH